MRTLQILGGLLKPGRQRAADKRRLELVCRDCGVSRTIARRIAALYFSEVADDAPIPHNERVRG